MPKVSIVVTVYNREHYLELTLQSILNQTFQDFEVIIVDDGSTDDSAIIAKQYADSHSNIFFYPLKDNIGFPASLNFGFNFVVGEYRTKIDSDDLFLPHALERMVFELDNNPTVDMVYCDMQVINETGKIVGSFTVMPPEYLIFSNRIGGCVLYRTEVGKKVGLYRNELFLVEDYEYWLRFNEIAKLKPIHEYHYQYRNHEKNISNTFEKAMIAKTIQLQKKYYPRYIKSRKQAALFYSHVRAIDIYNPFRQLYLLLILFYSPQVFYHLVVHRKIMDEITET